MKDSPDTAIRKILKTKVDGIWGILKALLDEQEQEWLIVVDGLDKVECQRGEFVRGLHTFIKYLQGESLKVKILLTSRPQPGSKKYLTRYHILNTIRKGKCLRILEFDNTRYDKITDEHKGTLEWLWTHNQYKEWSAADVSRLLYIQGKPEGALQTTHYNMLRSILYDILSQNESFFFHFQHEYRQYQALLRNHGQREWPYESLKRVFTALGNHPRVERLYLIIDAMDESNDEDRRDILKRLFSLCSKQQDCIVKVFVASRPLAQLEHRIRESHNFIRLQDETRPDIENFARSFLGQDLGFSGDPLEKAARYIVEQAQEVFLWVYLVGKELQPYAEKGCSKNEVFKQLRSLPTSWKIFMSIYWKQSKKDRKWTFYMEQECSN
ncbi:MAG: hypothetical protein M1840_008368 [Geoglossum simile]|nr:MAG: hypothetical protein M1840_008368 [Geoglossum simile]